MNFRHLPVLNHEDTTHNFEQLQSILKETEEALVRVTTQKSSLKQAHGSTELEWSAKGFESAVVTVSTGLGKVSQVLCTAFPGSAFVYASVAAVEGEKIKMQGRAAGELAAGTKITLFWMAIE